jgi:prophage regulatory protein
MVSRPHTPVLTYRRHWRAATTTTIRYLFFSWDAIFRTGRAAGVADKPSPMSVEARKSSTELPQLVPSPLPFRRTIRRAELRQIVPLADTTIYEMERRGEFPRRFYITSRCVVWDLEEVEAWIDARRNASNAALLKRAPVPDVRRRKRRPVRGEPAS